MIAFVVIKNEIKHVHIDYHISENMSGSRTEMFAGLTVTRQLRPLGSDGFRRRCCIGCKLLYITTRTCLFPLTNIFADSTCNLHEL